MTRPINVLYVSHYPHMKMGGQRSMAALISHLDRDRVRPMAVTPGPGDLTDALHAMDCPVFHVPLGGPEHHNPVRSIRSFLSLRRIYRRQNIHIVHPDAEWDVLECGRAKRGTGTKLVWHVRLTGSNKLDGKCEKLADGIIGISDGTKRRFTSDTIATKYRTIYNGVDLNIFHPVPEIHSLRDKLGLPHDRFILLFVGQIKREKGLFDLLEAVALLKEERDGKPLPHIICIGAPLQASIPRELSAMMEEKELRPHIRFIPQQRNIQEWMNAADTLILPSHEGHEGMGRVLFEAMACGTPVIGSDISGVREAITPESGILIPQKSPSDIARTIRQLMDDSNRQLRLAEGGLQRARTVFDITLHARAIEQFYQDLLTETL